MWKEKGGAAYKQENGIDVPPWQSSRQVAAKCFAMPILVPNTNQQIVH
jgi:hypothetical protein